MPITAIHGNTKGLKSNQLKALQRLYQQRVPGDCPVTPELAQRLAAVSTEIDVPVCLYLNRRGQVVRVGVGTPHQTQIPPLELPRYSAKRLSGIRCIATQPKPAPPKEASLTAMVVQRLDALLTLTLTGEGFQKRGGAATGYVRETYLAHLLPQAAAEGDPAERPYWTVWPPMSLDALSKQDFWALVESLEAEFEREHVAQQPQADRERAIVVGLMADERNPDAFAGRVAELERLVDTAGGKVLSTITQRRAQPHPKTVVGAGKIQEIALQAQTLGASLVACDRDLLPSQVRNLEELLGTRILDRTELILDIFAQHARSRAGKLQVELAQLEYKLPRLTGRGKAMSRLGGGIGTRGPGETQLETERRAIRRRIDRLQQEVNQLQAHRARLRERRQAREIPSVAFVGYTNAGKSTLLNALTSADIHTADRLFATLDPTTRRLAVPEAGLEGRREILLTDTVGFIQQLPSSLLDAFRATLEEVTEADALVHVVDLAHPAWERHMQSVQAVLSELPTPPSPILTAFNKIDCADGPTLTQARAEFPEAAFVSASQRMGLPTLRTRLGQLLERELAATER
ncbi:MAG: GTPase HflX [Cyanobacteria bacterium QS_8_64_29]|nr:MAG: GTPase HflX [Cyanobacteria bacterium QS_8_64_29]